MVFARARQSRRRYPSLDLPDQALLLFGFLTKSCPL